jgi:hypothetical protein
METTSPTQSPTPTPTSTPVPTQSPTATATPPLGQQVAWGDNNCSGAADPVDSLLTLRHDAGLNANTGDCPDMGVQLDVTLAAIRLWGDVDCSDAVDPVDSLKLLRFDAGLSVAQGEGCPAIEAPVAVSVP